MDVRFVRTLKASAAIGLAAADMAQETRYLLQSLERPLTAAQWIGDGAGAQMSDAVSLVADGFVQATRIPAGGPCVEQRLFDVLMSSSSDELYTLLTEEAKLRLGLVRGFAFILALERANTLAARQRLGLWLALDLCVRNDHTGLQALSARVQSWRGAAESQPPYLASEVAAVPR